MGCPSSEELARIALGLSRDDALAPHLRDCSRCRSELDALRALTARIAAAHEVFDRGHEEARERLLAALPETQPQVVPASIRNPVFHWIGALTMRQRLALGGACGFLFAALSLTFLGILDRPAHAMGQVADSIRKARTYEFQMTYELELPGPPGKPAVKVEMKGRVVWKAPGSYRIENKSTAGPMDMDQVTIASSDAPGIEIDRKAKKYSQRPPQRGAKSPLMMVEMLGNYSGQAEEDLGAKKVGGTEARGFRILGRKIDPDIPAGTTVDVWVDPKSNLPVLVTIAMKEALPPGTVTMSDFRWNGDLEPGLFDPRPPDGFAELSRPVPARDEQVRTIAAALKLFAKYAGHYPRVKMLYGDSTRDEFVKLSGAPYPPRKPEDHKDPRLTEVMDAMVGFATINGIQRENPDAAFHGSADKGKVLLRWKLEDGTYQVIYGDLRAEVVPADRLKDLEAR